MNELVTLSVSRYPWVGAALLIGSGIAIMALVLTVVAIAITAIAAPKAERRKDARKLMREIGRLLRLTAEVVKTLRTPNE